MKVGTKKEWKNKGMNGCWWSGNESGLEPVGAGPLQCLKTPLVSL